MSRWLPSAVGLGALLAVGGLWFADRPAYTQLLTLWGVAPFRYPFLDLGGSLAAWDCARHGADVILADPCDVLRRGYNYAPFWMTIDWIPLGQAARNWAGLGLDIGFLLSLAALPAPLSPLETAARVAAVLSYSVAFALERANPDLLIFLLVIAMLRLLRRSPAAYAIGFLAGLIKYYPFVLLALALREPPRRLAPIGCAVIIGIGCFLRIYAAGIAEGAPHIAGGQPFGDLFGAKDFALGIYLFLRQHHVPALAAAQLGLTAGAALCLAVGLLMARNWGGLGAALRGLDEPRRLALLGGALLIAGCFFAGQSVGYRAVFLLLVLPGLFGLARQHTAGARLAIIASILSLWNMAPRLWLHLALSGQLPLPGFVQTPGQAADFAIWLGREATWWLLVGYLSCLLLAFVLQAPLLQRRAPPPAYGPAFYNRAERSAFAAAASVAILQPLLRVGSVLDVGCAHGTWLAAWAAAGVADITGLDGDFVDPAALAVAPEHFVRADLAGRFALGRRYDLVQCLEVAEHLPPARAATLVADLVAHGDIVLFSAAPPGQGGACHVNEQPYEAWRALFETHGYIGFDCLRPQLRGLAAVPFWYRYNTILYISAQKIETMPPQLRASRLPRGAVADVSSWPFRARKSLLRRLPRSLIDRLARLNASLTARA